MIPSNTIPEVCNYANSETALREMPSPEQIAAGVLPLDSLPAAWWNCMWNDTNRAVNCTRYTIESIVTEVNNVLSRAGICVCSACTDQLLEAIECIKQTIGQAYTAGAVKSSTNTDKITIANDGTMSVNCLGNAAALTTASSSIVPAINELKANYDTCLGAVPSTLNTISSTKVQNAHASATTIYGVGSAANYGHLKISDIYDTNLGTTGMVASQKAVSDVFNYFLNATSGAKECGCYWRLQYNGPYCCSTCSHRGPYYFLNIAQSGWVNPIQIGQFWMDDCDRLNMAEGASIAGPWYSMGFCYFCYPLSSFCSCMNRYRTCGLIYGPLERVDGSYPNWYVGNWGVCLYGPTGPSVFYPDINCNDDYINYEQCCWESYLPLFMSPPASFDNVGPYPATCCCSCIYRVPPKQSGVITLGFWTGFFLGPTGGCLCPGDVQVRPSDWCINGYPLYDTGLGICNCTSRCAYLWMPQGCTQIGYRCRCYSTVHINLNVAMNPIYDLNIDPSCGCWCKPNTATYLGRYMCYIDIECPHTGAYISPYANLPYKCHLAWRCVYNTTTLGPDIVGMHPYNSQSFRMMENCHWSYMYSYCMWKSCLLAASRYCTCCNCNYYNTRRGLQVMADRDDYCYVAPSWNFYIES